MSFELELYSVIGKQVSLDIFFVNFLKQLFISYRVLQNNFAWSINWNLLFGRIYTLQKWTQILKL